MLRLNLLVAVGCLCRLCVLMWFDACFVVFVIIDCGFANVGFGNCGLPGFIVYLVLGWCFPSLFVAFCCLSFVCWCCVSSLLVIDFSLLF